MNIYFKVMTIEELQNKHINLDKDFFEENTHTNISIEFTINVLEQLKQIAINKDFNDVAYDNSLYFKIQELKQYLNE